MTDGDGDPVDPVAKRLSSIERAVGKLRVLAEENESRIKLIAEGHGAQLDSHGAILASHSAKLDSHSRKLDEIIEALEPLPQIRDFIERVAGEHDQRLTDLEKRVGIRE
jgi:hypothetical protein